MSSPTSLIVADDHPVFRAGLKQVVSADPSFAIVAEVGDGAAALAAIREHQPQLALLDLDLPHLSGLAIARTLQRERSPVRVIILTMHSAETLLNEALDAGVCGYVLKDNATVDVLNSLRTVAGGGIYLSPAVSGYLVRRADRAAALTRQKPGLADLTPTERRVLKLIAASKTSKDIGRELFISYRTVETHRSHICEKLGLRGSNKLLQFAIEHRNDL
jgi:DNA-binding NarL/FixJ family response regulator